MNEKHEVALSFSPTVKALDNEREKTAGETVSAVKISRSFKAKG